MIKLDDYCSLRFDMISMNEAMPSNVTVNLMDEDQQDKMSHQRVEWEYNLSEGVKMKMNGTDWSSVMYLDIHKT